jgi:hypothetical protein
MQEAVNMERRPLPAMRNFSHDGWLCTFTVQQQQEVLKFHQLAAEQPLPTRADGTVRQGRRYGPSITINITPARSTAKLVSTS